MIQHKKIYNLICDMIYLIDNVITRPLSKLFKVTTLKSGSTTHSDFGAITGQVCFKD